MLSSEEEKTKPSEFMKMERMLLAKDCVWFGFESVLVAGGG